MFKKIMLSLSILANYNVVLHASQTLNDMLAVEIDKRFSEEIVATNTYIDRYDALNKQFCAIVAEVKTYYPALTIHYRDLSIRTQAFLTRLEQQKTQKKFIDLKNFLDVYKKLPTQEETTLHILEQYNQDLYLNLCTYQNAIESLSNCNTATLYACYMSLKPTLNACCVSFKPALTQK